MDTLRKRDLQKCVEMLKVELAKLRTGRAHPSLLEHIRVEYYGNEVPLNQVANITIVDARTLSVAPWEKSLLSMIEKTIRTSDLGLNPATAGDVIRVPLPSLTEERRKEFIRIVRAEVENSRVAVRNVRRDANTHLKELLKKKTFSEDEERRAQDQVQKLTDKFIAEADKLQTTKEADLMAI